MCDKKYDNSKERRFGRLNEIINQVWKRKKNEEAGMKTEAKKKGEKRKRKPAKNKSSNGYVKMGGGGSLNKELKI